MDQAIEVLSQDFDLQYVEEEEILKRLEHFAAGQAEPMYLPLRAPGGEFWPQLREQDGRRRKAEVLREQLNKIMNELASLSKAELALSQPAPEGEDAAVATAAEPEPRMTQEQISERRNALTG